MAHVGQECRLGTSGRVGLFHGIDQAHGFAGQLRVGPFKLLGALSNPILQPVMGLFQFVFSLFSGSDVDTEHHYHALAC